MPYQRPPLGDDGIQLWPEEGIRGGAKREVLVVGAKSADGVSYHSGEASFLTEKRRQAP